jgi:hypothetical protein
VPDIQWSHGEKSGSQRGTIVYFAGLRYCPNPDCQIILTTFSDSEGRGASLRLEAIKFDAANLSPSVMGSLEEAVKCHAAGRFAASALMVRRILEQFCNQLSNGGDSLQRRLAAVNAFASMSQGHLSDNNGLRILINDDGSIPIKEQAVSRDENELAVELAKQLLRAVYQYANLKTYLLSLRAAPGM